MERLRKAGGELVYRCAKQYSEPGHDKRGTQVDEITLTPLELIDRIAALVPPPRTHRHRYFGVLAPNSPHRASATALAVQTPQPPQVQAEPATDGAGAHDGDLSAHEAFLFLTADGDPALFVGLTLTPRHVALLRVASRRIGVRLPIRLLFHPLPLGEGGAGPADR